MHTPRCLREKMAKIGSLPRPHEALKQWSELFSGKKHPRPVDYVLNHTAAAVLREYEVRVEPAITCSATRGGGLMIRQAAERVWRTRPVACAKQTPSSAVYRVVTRPPKYWSKSQFVKREASTSGAR